MAISLEGTPSAATSAGTTKSCTVVSATNSILIVAVEGYNASTTVTFTATTFNGVSMTAGPMADVNTEGSEHVGVRLFYLVNPDVTTANIVATTNANSCHIAYAQYSGVDQTTPIGNTGTSSDTSSPFQVSVTPTASGNLIVAAAGGITGGAFTPQAGTTEVVEGRDSGNFATVAIYSQATTGTSPQTLGWTGTADGCAIGAVELLVASSGTDTPKSIAISCSTTVSLGSFSIAKQIAIACSGALSLLHASTRHLTIACTSSVVVSAGRSVLKAIQIACASSVSVGKGVGKLLQLACNGAVTAHAGVGHALAIAISCTTSVAVSTLKALYVPIVQIVKRLVFRRVV
jgi:hypothetical protein